MTERCRNDFDVDEREMLRIFGDDRAGCPSPEIVRARNEGVLPPELSSRLEDHLSNCTLCTALERDLSEVDVEQLTSEANARIKSRLPFRSEGSREPHRFWNWTWQPALVVGAVAILLIIAVLRTSKPPVHVAVETASIQAPKPAANLIPIEKPAVKLTASALVLRGNDAGNHLAEDLAPAFNAYRAGDFPSAIRHFEVLEPKYPKSVEVEFYLGVSQLLNGQYASAMAPLSRAEKLGNGSFREDAQWYLMLAHQRAGDLQNAEQERGKICASGGPYSERACAFSAK